MLMDDHVVSAIRPSPFAGRYWLYRLCRINDLADSVGLVFLNKINCILTNIGAIMFTKEMNSIERSDYNKV